MNIFSGVCESWMGSAANDGILTIDRALQFQPAHRLAVKVTSTPAPITPVGTVLAIRATRSGVNLLTHRVDRDSRSARKRSAC